MPSLVELQHNPYIPEMRVLIDGKQPPDFSRLVQYSDEDIWYWYKDILDAIYSEIRNDFAISFTGTPQDAEVLEFVCRHHKFCRGFKARDFMVSDPLQMRMQRLNQYIKRTNNVAFSKTIIDASFLLTPKMQGYLEDISAIDVNNLFCAVRVSTLGMQSPFEETENGFMFLIADSSESVDNYIQRFQTRKPIFVIFIGRENGLREVTDRALIYDATPDSMFNTIFSCFLQAPLLMAFRRCIKSIQASKNDAELKKLSCIEPLIGVEVENRIEVGKSAKISVSLDPPLGQVPKLIYKIANHHVASCDGLCVFGKQEGSANLEVYRSGDAKPFAVREISVYKRNRITKLILSDDSLLLGVGDRKRIKCDYAPVDADNTQTITWKSSDESVIRIDKNGGISAISKGACRIICTAENVSAQCICTVKPYLKDISVDIELEEGVLYLEPLSEITLQVAITPSDCVDGELTVVSSDYNVVNVVKNTLYAKDKGEAEITIRNSTGRVSQSFKAVIAKKKVGFFKSLFGKK